MASTLSNPLSETEQIVELQKKLVWAELKIQVLEEQLRLQRINKYGPGSEKLNDAQLQLLEFEPGVSHAEVQATVLRTCRPRDYISDFALEVAEEDDFDEAAVDPD